VFQGGGGGGGLRWGCRDGFGQGGVWLLREAGIGVRIDDGWIDWWQPVAKEGEGKSVSRM